MLSKVFDKKSYENLELWLPDPFAVNSFDCARFSMGTCVIEIDPYIVLPKLVITGSAMEKLTLLEAHLEHVSSVLDRLIRTSYVGVWNLGKVEHAWEAAIPLKRKLDKLDTKFGVPNLLLYEFQMSLNDKSRMISTMLAYHYAGRKTVRIAPALKNTLCVANAITRSMLFSRCPVTANRKLMGVKKGDKKRLFGDVLFGKREVIDLNIQTFLACFTDSYAANKAHTQASLEWWVSAFHNDISKVPQENLDDAADAFCQLLAALRKRLC